MRYFPRSMYEGQCHFLQWQIPSLCIHQSFAKVIYWPLDPLILPNQHRADGMVGDCQIHVQILFGIRSGQNGWAG